MAEAEEIQMTEGDDGKLRDSEIALMDAIRTILEIIVDRKSVV